LSNPNEPPKKHRYGRARKNYKPAPKRLKPEDKPRAPMSAPMGVEKDPARMEKGAGPQSASPELLELRRQKLLLKEKQVELREGLPFLHGWKWYPWAREFYESQNKINLLCAANQISKSSTQIRKCINWATDRTVWSALWGRPPVQFWYLYPTNKQASAEFETKWQLFLPRGKYKDDPVYGWEEEWKNKEIYAIHFKSGVHLYFKTYAQDVQSLQTGTCDALFCDEELPVDLYDELIFRISASDGYFHMVFTATLGQDFWRRAMEPGYGDVEALPGAWKRTVSMYECKVYEDGTPSHWTDEKIQIVKNRCKNHTEVLKRVYGKFIVDAAGLKYPQFDISRHMVKPAPVPTDWLIFGGADVGSGSKEGGHPSAICFVAVAPDFRSGRVILGWRGDHQQTTAGDVVEKFIALREERKLTLTGQYYDWGCKDMETIATRMGEPFLPADKSHERGEQIVNVLFKNNLMVVEDTDELRKLATELSTLRKETPKTKAKDDLADAFRYAVTRIPWDWTVIQGVAIEDPDAPAKKEAELSPMQREILERRRQFDDEANAQEHQRIEAEFAEFNELCEY
jgi:hypothetical protein